MTEKPVSYTRYPWSSIITYNGVTVLHFLLGGIGIFLGYNYLAGYILGSIYLIFAFGEMYLHMPLRVCPNCVYFGLKDSRCISGLNGISRKITRQGNVKLFPDRARGLLCSNNLYIAALVIPIIALVPALIINFSSILLAVLIALIGLLLFRFFVIFTRIACVHCLAKKICPQARSMGFAD
jgi:hypothetical protein